MSPDEHPKGSDHFCSVGTFLSMVAKEMPLLFYCGSVWPELVSRVTKSSVTE